MADGGRQPHKRTGIRPGRREGGVGWGTHPPRSGGCYPGGPLPRWRASVLAHRRAAAVDQRRAVGHLGAARPSTTTRPTCSPADPAWGCRSHGCGTAYERAGGRAEQPATVPVTTSAATQPRHHRPRRFFGDEPLRSCTCCRCTATTGRLVQRELARRIVGGFAGGPAAASSIGGAHPRAFDAEPGAVPDQRPPTGSGGSRRLVALRWIARVLSGSISSCRPPTRSSTSSTCRPSRTRRRPAAPAPLPGGDREFTARTRT